MPVLLKKAHPVNHQDRERGSRNQVHFSSRDFSKNPNILSNCTEQFWSTSPCYKFSWTGPENVSFFVGNFLALALVLVCLYWIFLWNGCLIISQTPVLSNRAADMTLTERHFFQVLVPAAQAYLFWQLDNRHPIHHKGNTSSLLVAFLFIEQVEKVFHCSIQWHAFCCCILLAYTKFNQWCHFKRF